MLWRSPRLKEEWVSDLREKIRDIPKYLQPVWRLLDPWLRSHTGWAFLGTLCVVTATFRPPLRPTPSNFREPMKTCPTQPAPSVKCLRRCPAVHPGSPTCLCHHFYLSLICHRNPVWEAMLSMLDTHKYSIKAVVIAAVRFACRILKLPHVETHWEEVLIGWGAPLMVLSSRSAVQPGWTDCS